MQQVLSIWKHCQGLSDLRVHLFLQNYLRTDPDNEDDPVGLPKRTHHGRLAGYGHREGFRTMHVGAKGRRADFDRAH